MKKIFLSFAVFSFLLLGQAGNVIAVDISPQALSADDTAANEDLFSNFILFPTSFYKGIVVEIVENGEKDYSGYITKYQIVNVRILDGEFRDTVVNITFMPANGPQDITALTKGETVILGKTSAEDGKVEFVIYDKYRLTPIIFIAVAFFVLVIIFGSRKGFFSIFGLLVSILVLIFFILPQIIAGHNPLLISMLGAAMIAVTSLYLAHGFQKRTTIALISTLITLGISFLLTIMFVSFAKLSGAGSEDAISLQLDPSMAINLRGLLLGGIIIGVLGVLDDVTTAQVAAVEEIHKANERLSFRDLYSRGISVGREHIASLVNTLVLAYAGASFPLLLLFTMNKEIPLWVTINGEMMAEELIRTLVGSTTLIFAVPISTFLAVYFFKRKKL